MRSSTRVRALVRASWSSDFSASSSLIFSFFSSLISSSLALSCSPPSPVEVRARVNCCAMSDISRARASSFSRSFISFTRRSSFASSCATRSCFRLFSSVIFLRSSRSPRGTDFSSGLSSPSRPGVAPASKVSLLRTFALLMVPSHSRSTRASPAPRPVSVEAASSTPMPSLSL